MEYLIRIENFEGPFDLLLHLIKQEELNIWEVEIATITDQYLRYLEEMKYQNLKVASEYLYMAAYLVEIKSKMLLPKEVVEIEGEYQENPQEMLVRQLLEYKRFKDLSELLSEKETERKQYLDAYDSHKETYMQTLTSLKKNKNIEDLALSLKKLYSRIESERPITSSMQNKEISIDQACETIIEMIHANINKKIKISEVLNRLPIHDFVVTFLAILDLTKNKQLTVEQVANDDIEIKFIGGTT